MANDTLTLALEGEHIPLERFAQAASHFAALVRALSDAVDARSLRWEVERLDTSSAIMTTRGIDEHEQDGAVGRVASSYIEVGEALGHGATIPFPGKVAEEARALAEVLADGVEALRFENAETEIFVRQVPARKAPPEPTALVGQHAYGAVTGRVQTLSSRSGLRFTLYDLLSDRAVNCYVRAGVPLMADIWDKLATVEGMVTRDPVSGRPLNVRQITGITIHQPPDPGGYQRARGVMARRPGEPRAEDRIRRLRDGG